MVYLVSLLEAPENRNGILYRGLFHLHRLKTALKSGILLHVFPILVECRRSDGP